MAVATKRKKSALCEKHPKPAPELPPVVPPVGPQPLKLNLGSGGWEIDGFTNIDDHLGSSVYPLPDWVQDNSVDEIYASHIYEHLPHSEAVNVMCHWVKKMRPGARIRIAVPDFKDLATRYLRGDAGFNPQGYIMGGQKDAGDYHKAIFDKELLTEIMVYAGLEKIQEWISPQPDCASLPISLNLQGWKPITQDGRPTGIRCVASVPRLGFNTHYTCIANALGPLGISPYIRQGSIWHIELSRAMEQVIRDPDCKYVLTLDYDSVFEASDVYWMYRLMQAYQQIDALVPVQSKRASKGALFNKKTADGEYQKQISMSEFGGQCTKIFSGHFGLTLFRADALRSFPRPWMIGEPHKGNGQWEDDEDWQVSKIDPDIHFWHNWEKAKKTVYLANQVGIGHIEEVITWPNGKDFSPVYQSTKEFFEGGRPKEVQG
jgi:predicted SAM-dependent methyltransferase